MPFLAIYPLYEIIIGIVLGGQVNELPDLSRLCPFTERRHVDVKLDNLIGFIELINGDGIRDIHYASCSVSFLEFEKYESGNLGNSPQRTFPRSHSTVLTDERLVFLPGGYFHLVGQKDAYPLEIIDVYELFYRGPISF